MAYHTRKVQLEEALLHSFIGLKRNGQGFLIDGKRLPREFRQNEFLRVNLYLLRVNARLETSLTKPAIS